MVSFFLPSTQVFMAVGWSVFFYLTPTVWTLNCTSVMGQMNSESVRGFNQWMPLLETVGGCREHGGGAVEGGVETELITVWTVKFLSDRVFYVIQLKWVICCPHEWLGKPPESVWKFNFRTSQISSVGVPYSSFFFSEETILLLWLKNKLLRWWQVTI